VNIVCLPAEKTVHRAWLRKPVAREAFDLFREGLKRHDRIVALVERMLRLQQEPPGPLPPEENEIRLREIAATDAEIDALVCDLYGLTAEEIRILEESGSHI
jgi:hypothetical protein